MRIRLMAACLLAAAPACRAAESGGPAPVAEAPAGGVMPGWASDTLARLDLRGRAALAKADAALAGMNRTDLAVSALSTGAAVGVAGYACGTLGAGLGPMAAGAAYFGCSWAGGYLADVGLRGVYARLDLVPDETAFAVGQVGGSVVGGWQAARGITGAATRQALRNYGAITSSSLGEAVPGMLRQAGQATARRIAIGAALGYFGLDGPAQAQEPVAREGAGNGDVAGAGPGKADPVAR